MEKYFEIKQLKVNHKTFEGTKNVLDIDHLAIEKGKTYGIVGESGAGKTVLALTILKLLAMPPGEIASGEIFLDGENLLRKTQSQMRKIRGKKISMIFQDPLSALNPVFTVGHQLMQVIKNNQKVTEKKAEKMALEMIERVKLPDAVNIMNKYPHELSGGQRQRVIIAMALSCGAEFLIADEPTRNLDVTLQAGILKLIKELQEQFNVTVLFITNNLALVSVLCDEIAILYKGKIVERGLIHDVLEKPQHAYTKSLLNAAMAKVNKKKKETKENNEATILKVDSLKKYFPIKKSLLGKTKLAVKAVDGVDFEIKKGEVLGIVGESGCGKSTLVNTVLFLHEPTEGKVIFENRDIFNLNKRDLKKVRKDVQIIFQDPFWSLNPRWLVRDIVGEPLKVHQHLSTEAYVDRVGELLEMVGLSKEDAFKYPHEFSGGQRQRIAIARALSVDPDLVVLDEPTSAIDVISEAQILALLSELREKMKLTYALISHDLSVVNYMADKIIVMYLGKIVEYGKAEEVFKNPLHPYTVALFNAVPKLRTYSVEELSALKGDVPSAINPPKGCRFHTRCEKATEICKTIEPEPINIDGRIVACHLYKD